MNKKLIAILSVLILLFLLFFFFQNRLRSLLTLTDTYSMRGIITRVTGDSIFVKGAYKNTKNAGPEVDGLIEFYFSPQTVYVNRVIIIPKIRPKRTFSPKTEERIGVRTDLILGKIVQLEYKNNLFQNNKVTVSKVVYSAFQYEK